MAHNETLLINGVETQVRMFDHSAQEIDAAVGRAVSGGALDTSVENVSKELGTFVRPNLLDNWYFGRPVDQRGGKIIQQGVNIYTNSALTTLIGPAAYACPVVELTSTYAKVQDEKNTSSYYYAAPGDVVRGYTGDGYGIDRWTSLSGTITMGVGDDGLMVSTTVTSGATEVCQYFESYIKAGTMLTLSAIVSKSETSQNGILRVKYTNNEAGVQMSLPARAMDHELVSITQESKLDVVSCVMRISNGDGYTVHAIKLEMGDTQTLAHQDSAGNWVLNEVPDYGEQLRRCQRYYRRILPAQYAGFARGCAYNANSARIIIPFETMRTSPSIDLNNASGLFASNGATGDVFSLSFSVAWTTPESITFDIAKTGAFVDGKEYYLRGDGASYIDIIADL